jgi:hypothetical protein
LGLRAGLAAGRVVALGSRRAPADCGTLPVTLRNTAPNPMSLRGAGHFTFSDDGALLKSRLLRGVLRVSGLLGIDGPRQLAVTAYCVHSLCDAYLKPSGVSPANPASPLYPELQVLE